MSCNIVLRIDNATALSYINRMGGVQHLKLNGLPSEIWQWCEIRNIWLFARYINCKGNVEADRQLRSLSENTE